MRLFADFITETKREDAEYASMMQPMQRIVDRIGAEPFVLEEIKEFPHYVADLKRSLRRYDRIIPLIKSFRGYLAEMLIQDRLGDMDQREIKYLKAQADFHKEWRVFDHQKIAHYAAMFPLVPAMERYVWQGKSPKQIIDDLEEIESKWRASRVGTVAPRESDKPIINFEDGYAWVLLPRGGCPEEGDAMGHCGNGSGFGADRIYSLREKIKVEGETRWKPCLTFIVHETKGSMLLGEMKGRANTKPSPKYHDKIVALLASDYVDGIRGGGYKPENNFSIMDLPVNQRRVLAHKPKLWGVNAVLAKGAVEEFVMEGRTYVSVPKKKTIFATSHRDIAGCSDTDVGIVSGHIVVKNGKLISSYETHLILRDEVESVDSPHDLAPDGFIDNIVKVAANEKPYLWYNVYDVTHHPHDLRSYSVKGTYFHVPDFDPNNRFSTVGKVHLLMKQFQGKVASVAGYIDEVSGDHHASIKLTREEALFFEDKTNKPLSTYYLPDELVEERLIADPAYLDTGPIWSNRYGSEATFKGKTVYRGEQGVWVSDAPESMYRYFEQYNNGPLYISKGNAIVNDADGSIVVPPDVSVEEFSVLYKENGTVRKGVERAGLEVGVKYIDDYEEYLGKKVKVTGR